MARIFVHENFIQVLAFPQTRNLFPSNHLREIGYFLRFNDMLWSCLCEEHPACHAKSLVIEIVVGYLRGTHVRSSASILHWRPLARSRAIWHLLVLLGGQSTEKSTNSARIIRPNGCIAPSSSMLGFGLQLGRRMLKGSLRSRLVDTCQSIDVTVLVFRLADASIMFLSRNFIWL